MPPLSSYLASKYLTADPSTSSTSKKRKRKQPSTSTGLIIADDDDDSSWKDQNAGNNEEDGPLLASTRSAEFRKSKKSAWKVVGSAAPSQADLDRNGDAAAADAIIASAAAESAAAINLDEAPVVEGEDEDDGIVKMGDGTHAGLQSAAAVSAQMERRKREEMARWEAEEAAAARATGKKRTKGQGEETVYRDATGRRIDISMRRAEARRELDEKERKEREMKEAQKGDVQRAAAAKRREDLDEARFIPLARTVDDEEMNEELRRRERWNDPAAQFLSDRKGGTGGGGKGVSKKVYTGAAPPNRYGIRPGHRWDGVDRGNGWEAERFKEINRRTRNKELDFAWQIDT
ncbi:MAG: Pre-mRNA-splicing factor cwc26 [Claussenomyces sp. TS43310]|nr:MAG: Pre-mRNA-splicing factor cwc26 [Claussenomyces sp. TS43310]